MVEGYYRADILAEQILAQLIEADEIPASIGGVEIHIREEEDEDGEILTFVLYASPVTERKDLVVELLVNGTGFKIISWRLMNTTDWIPINDVGLHEGFSFLINYKI